MIPFPGGPRRASEVAALVRGALAGADVLVHGVAPVEAAGPMALAFLDRGRPGGAGVHLARTPGGGTTVVVADPLGALCDLLAAWLPEATFTRPVDLQAHVHPTATLGPGVVVGPGCSVGAHTVLFPNVVLYPGTRVGARCRIHAGAVLGADGFRYHPGPGGPRKVPQVGGVQIGDDVEIGAGCTIDRGFLADTVLGDGCKLDNQVHVGHNCRLGRFVLLAAQTGLSGSCTIGDGAMLGGQVGLAERTVVGAGARIGAQSGLHGEVPAGETWLGTPALPIAVMRRVYGAMPDVPAIWRAWRAGGAAPQPPASEPPASEPPASGTPASEPPSSPGSPRR